MIFGIEEYTNVATLVARPNLVVLFVRASNALVVTDNAVVTRMNPAIGTVLVNSQSQPKNLIAVPVDV